MLHMAIYPYWHIFERGIRIMSKTLVVVGATGSQGRAVINYFQSQEPSWSIRGLTRNPASDSAVQIGKSSVDIVKADLNDVGSLKTAFKGANYIFAYTDFAGIVGSPEVMGKFQTGELTAPVGAGAYKIELQQGKNIADAAASIPELERLVWSALPGVKRLSKGNTSKCTISMPKPMLSTTCWVSRRCRGQGYVIAQTDLTDYMSREDWSSVSR